MKVKQLIRELKKMPQNSEVGVAMHDNGEGEVAGWVCSVCIEEELDPDTGFATKYPAKKTGKENVILRC